MKRILLILFCLAVWLPAGASVIHMPMVQDVQANMVIGSGSGGGGTSCSGIYGNNTILTMRGGTPDVDSIILFRIQLDPACGGSNPDVYGYLKDTHHPIYNTRLIVYEDNGSGTDPADYLWSGETDGTDPAAWEHLTSSLTVAPGSEYIWVGIWTSSGGTDSHFESTGGVSRSISGATYTNSAPDPWPSATDTEDTYDGSFYLSF